MNLRYLRLAIAPILAFTLLAQENPPMIYEGTPVRMRINRTVSSADAHEGDEVDFETLDDVMLKEIAIIPKGSIAIGTVTEAVPKRRMARGGKLNMTINYLRLPNGEKLPLRGIQDVKGGGHVGVMTGAIVASGILFFPAAPLFLFMKGKDITIPKGQEITVYTNTDYDPSKSVPTAKTNGNALTNADVLKLKAAGVSEQLIIDKIRSSPANYTLETNDLLKLKKAGISDGIVSAMLEASRK